MIIVGIGVTPNVELARSCRLNVDNGVLVNRHLLTSDDDICAAGTSPTPTTRCLPATPRRTLGQRAASAGRCRQDHARKPATYDRLPYFFTDQYDLGMEYTGYTQPDGHDQVVIRSDLHARSSSRSGYASSACWPG